MIKITNTIRRVIVSRKTKTKDNETVIYKLSQGNSSNPKNIFFLIFKDGNLSDAYFNLPDEEKIERKFYTLSTAIELAKQYAMIFIKQM